MPEIHVLPKEIAELIAAGEVIERPASVLKELTENAIDSGAKRITAELKRGGVTYLRVTDDGCGIAPEQVRTAFLRHATSKIRAKEDLESIFTLGFRGEALASVCAVSRTELLTRQPDASLGTHYIIEGGEETCFEESGCPAGTTVIVRDLFYNVPVRAGFLKKDTAEGNAAANIFQKIAMSHPEISFRFIRENRTEFTTPGDGQLYSAVYAIFGRDFARDLLTVDYAESAENGISVKGYIMKPLYSRPNRAHQFFFVNGRSVRSFALTSAIEDAYKTLIMTGKYPACVLMLNISPRIVDVNMHPTKAEVRFSDEKRVYAAVYFAVMSALSQNHLVYEFQLPQNAPEIQQYQPETKPVQPPVQPVSVPEQTERQPVQNPVIPPAPLPPLQPNPPAAARAIAQAVPQTNPPAITPETLIPQKPKRDWFAPVAGTDNNTPAPLIPAPEKPAEKPVPPPALAAFPELNRPAKTEPLPEEPKARNEAISAIQREPIQVIGELFDNYVLAQAGEQFVMIDKHAAHERILFEKFRNRECKDRQTLLKPVRVLLTEEEIAALQDCAETLSGCGFTFDFSESPVVQMLGIPLSCETLDLDEIAQNLAAACLHSIGQPDMHLLDDLFHDLACKAAIKSGTHNTTEELQSLAVQVWENEAIRHCPHGRPVMFLLSKYQIEKQFMRIQH